jgi:hypothetical protein
MAGVRISTLPVATSLPSNAVTVVVSGGVNYQASTVTLVTAGLPAQAGNANLVLRTSGTGLAWSTGFSITSAGQVTVQPGAGMPSSGCALTVMTLTGQTGPAIAITDVPGTTQLVKIGPGASVTVGYDGGQGGSAVDGVLTVDAGGRHFNLRGTAGNGQIDQDGNVFVVFDPSTACASLAPSPMAMPTRVTSRPTISGSRPLPPTPGHASSFYHQQCHCWQQW